MKVEDARRDIAALEDQIRELGKIAAEKREAVRIAEAGEQERQKVYMEASRQRADALVEYEAAMENMNARIAQLNQLRSALAQQLSAENPAYTATGVHV